ncbi:MAG: sigma 54-interacting transcriptional regulator [Candidatus Solibacter sp.]
MNCGSLSSELMENELFGHVGGAFTGARLHTQGLVAAAENGTLFLDEVDALTLNAQVKLLRFIQQKEYRRLGEPRLGQDAEAARRTDVDMRKAIEQVRQPKVI